MVETDEQGKEQVMSVTNDPQKDMEAALARVMGHIPAGLAQQTPAQVHQEYMQEAIAKKAAIAAVNRAALAGEVRVIRGPIGESLVQDSVGNIVDLSDVSRRGYLRMLHDKLHEKLRENPESELEGDEL
jgi:hypothetical protein